jgi:hypothetical protein
MEALGILLVLAIPAVIVWALVSIFRHGSRLSSVEQELRQQSSKQEALIAMLTRRIFVLEEQLAKGGSTAPAPAPVVGAPPEPVHVPEEPPYVEPIPIEPEPQPEPELIEVHTPLQTAYVPPPPQPPPPPVPSRTAAEWEAMVGGSWLNAIGVLILVVGISLFLGYALTQFGPAGKIGIGLACGVVMLIAGIFIERREQYAVFGRGAIAGGWAALYFTTYAMHGLPAARVIDSPFVGGALLLAVACGMIAHSLRYRSQALTLLAYASAYLALLLGPASAFSIGATLPLTVSLLAVSRQMDWLSVPLAGAVFTYWTFAFRYDEQALTPAIGAAALIAYWLCFEIYDLLRLRRATLGTLQDFALFHLNALLFFGTAAMVLPPSDRIAAANFLTVMGSLYLMSTVFRMQWQQAIPQSPSTPATLLAQSHRLAIVLMAALFAQAILKRFEQPWSAEIGLLLEAQLLVLASLRTSESIFRYAGAAIFAFAAFLLGAREDEFQKRWVPFTFVMPAMFYVNRWLTRSGIYYTWGALALLLWGVSEVSPQPWIGTIAIAIAVVLLEVHARIDKREFLQQSFAAAIIGLLCLFVVDKPLPLAAGAALFYLAGWTRRDLAILPGTLLAALAMWYGLPAALVAPGWGLLALLLLETVPRPALRDHAHVLAFAAFGRLYYANFPILSDTYGISHRLLTVVPMILLALYGWRSTTEKSRIATAYSWAAAILTGSLLRFELGRTLVVIGWAVQLLILLHLGLSRRIRDFQYQAYALALVTFFRGWATNFNSPDLLLGMPQRVLTGAFVIAVFHAAQFRLPRDDRHARPAFSLLASALLGILLYYEISGSLLTIAWGAQAVGLIMVGFWASERIMRLTGLAGFLLCILKLFLYDLRTLDTLSRIVSFIVLGLVLMGASWLYMRFKDKIQRFL